LKRALAALQRGPVRFRRNNVLACEGDSADYIFIVVSGVLRSCKIFKNGSHSIVAFYLPGDVLGWSEARYMLNVEAVTDAMVLFLKRKTLMSVAARESRVANFLLDVATAELRRTQEHAVLMSQSAKYRVAKFLTDLCGRLGRPKSLSLPMSHQDIADHLGLTIETLSRVITNLERSGLVGRASRQTLVLPDERLLAQVCD
jgi:CRP/FNR family nitrogen fixation transcriptional regulator